MPALRPLTRRFFARDAVTLARALLGKVLVHDSADGTTAGRIVETEAYDETDPASHSARGRTPRNDAMFGPAGHAYVYFSYGVHWCMNVVAGRDGQGAAVLLRALAPLDGVALMALRRGIDDDRTRLCRGPGSLAQAMGIGRDHYGADLVRGPLRVVADGVRIPSSRVQATARVGISKAVDVPWRFVVERSPYLSGPSLRRR